MSLKNNAVVIYGINPVLEAIQSKIPFKEIWIESSKKDKYQQIIKHSKENNIPLFFKDLIEIVKLQKDHHQGILAFVRIKDIYHSIEDFYRQNQSVAPHIFVILDSIKDPRNLGAILRNCDHFAVTAVIIPKHQSAPISSIVYKTSSGALHYIPIIQLTNLVQGIKLLKKKISGSMV